MKAWSQTVAIPTVEPGGRVCEALHLENRYLRVTMLPEAGGRIHSVVDKTGGLVDCESAIQAGVPGPTETHIEEHEDGGRTVWFSGHEPEGRLKRMHGVSLHPGRAYVEIAERIYNRTPYVQTVAGWAGGPVFAPYETKVSSRYWYPTREIGESQKANREAAVSVRAAGRKVRVAVMAARPQQRAVVKLERRGKTVLRKRVDIDPGAPYMVEAPVHDVVLVTTADGVELIRYVSGRAEKVDAAPAAAPPLPADIGTNEDLYLTGLHLEQQPEGAHRSEEYWNEALRRDRGDARSNNAMGAWHLRRGEYTAAELHFRAAIATLTRRNSSPYDGEPCYNLGLALRFVGREEEAYAAFRQATGNFAWRSAGYFQMAQLDARHGCWMSALEYLQRAVQHNSGHLGARSLAVIALRRLGQDEEAEALLDDTLAVDPLDCWARHLHDGTLPADAGMRLDLAVDYEWAGLTREAIAVLAGAERVPMVRRALACLRKRTHPLPRRQLFEDNR